MSNQPQPSRRPTRAGVLTVVVALAIAAIYFFNVTGVSILGPTLGGPETPEAALTGTPVDAPVQEAAVSAESTPAAEAAAEEAAPAAVSEPTDAPVEEPTEEPTAEPTEEPTEAPTEAPTEVPTATSTPLPAPTATRAATPVPASINGLPTILWDELPREAHETIQLIDEGGPFPFDRDGITFQNRERLLPQERNGYYREYTVITPGENDRGARRIVEGAEGELYYTDDHYDSFYVVIRDEAR